MIMTDLEGIRVQLAHDRTFTMQGVVVGWQRHIARLAEEMRGPVRQETWGAHDYFAALSLRDLVETGRYGLARRHDHLVAASVAATDELLREITEEDRRGVVVRYGEPEPSLSSRWWWHRLPTRGLVREELDSWYANEE
ncbi:hypothetical protein QE370_000887 [Aeromicrobium sp. SORGH_AS981]|uniref:hypothetical protein n=1 Tax=Aeromicrobium sp. SORGH_AS_0981 TaxID=3041802 RepID=UPI00285A6B18|nr:hypothetical protein [Aeromicrobium sp. SORGH_AS_0981]MDR6117703.1 hypothetical protein [Aeromicrobium sp. SORGH_AS_0981]